MASSLNPSSYNVTLLIYVYDSCSDAHKVEWREKPFLAMSYADDQPSEKGEFNDDINLYEVNEENI